MSVDNNINNSSNSTVPQWIEAKLFEEPLKQVEKYFEEILDFKVAGALAPGENYATVMLKAELVIKLKGKEKGEFLLIYFFLNTRILNTLNFCNLFTQYC